MRQTRSTLQSYVSKLWEAASERIASRQQPVGRGKPAADARLERQPPREVHGPGESDTWWAPRPKDANSWVSASESAFDRIEAVMHRLRFNAPVVLNPPSVRPVPRAQPKMEDLGDLLTLTGALAANPRTIAG